MGALGTLGANLGVYLGAFALTLLVVVYGLRVPHLLTEAGPHQRVLPRAVGHQRALDLLNRRLLRGAQAQPLRWAPSARWRPTVVIAAVAAHHPGFVVLVESVDPTSFSLVSPRRVEAGHDVVLLVVMYLVYRRGCALLGVGPCCERRVTTRPRAAKPGRRDGVQRGRVRTANFASHLTNRTTPL